MTPFLAFFYLCALAAGVVLNGLALILLRMIYVWLLGPTDNPKAR